MESLAVSQVLGNQVPASSTKPLTGHTLGASGAIEAALCWIVLPGTRSSSCHRTVGRRGRPRALPALPLVAPATRLHRHRGGAEQFVRLGGSNAVLALERR